MTTHTLAQARKQIEAIKGMLQRRDALMQGESLLAALPKGSIMKDGAGNIIAHKF